MFWIEIEFLFYVMTKKNKNKGKNPKPIPLTKYTNMLELKEEVKGVATTYPLLTNGGLLKSQTVSDNSVHTIDGIIKKRSVFLQKQIFIWKRIKWLYRLTVKPLK